METFLERQKKLLTLNQEEIENLPIHITSKQIQAVRSRLPTKKSPRPIHL